MIGQENGESTGGDSLPNGDGPYTPEAVAEVINQRIALPGGDGFLAEATAIGILSRVTRGEGTEFDKAVLSRINTTLLEPPPHAE